MFELVYPGNCFGNIDISAKECKKCKIKQFCIPSGSLIQKESGITRFREILFDRFVCDVEKVDGEIDVKCFEKVSMKPFMTVAFSDNGSISVRKGETQETVTHIVSKEKAESLFNKICEPQEETAKNSSENQTV